MCVCLEDVYIQFLLQHGLRYKCFLTLINNYDTHCVPKSPDKIKRPCESASQGFQIDKQMSLEALNHHFVHGRREAATTLFEGDCEGAC